MTIRTEPSTLLSGPILPSAHARTGGALAHVAADSSAQDEQANAPYGGILLARLADKADLSQEALMPRGPERKAAVYRDLLDTATRSQGAALAKLAELKQQGLVTSFESMFMPNAIVITAASGQHQAVADALKGIANIKGVSENRTWAVGTRIDAPSAPAADAAAGAAQVMAGPRPEWNVEKIGAPAAWQRGFTGSGVVVGIVDTGLESTHPAIAPHYRGSQSDGSQVHDYNWYDPFRHTAKAFDDGEHGTHVAGTTAGGNDARAIGVAPGAKIIAAKAILGSGYNTTTGTLQALQFMLAPTRTDGTAPDPTKGADVINNSWGNADREDTTFEDSFNALKAAGIEVVSAAGNDGPRGKVSPPGSYPGHITVAATTSSDSVASFSSRGPSKFARPGEMIPNLAAPGSGITSSVPGGRFASFSGTSMASPAVAGAVALLLQARPQATHDQIVAALEKTATDIDASGPDDASGYGRINVDKAIDYLLSH